MEDKKAKGIPDLLETAFEIKCKTIYSEKLNNFSQEMNEYKENNIDTKLNDIKDLIKEKIKPIETIKIIIHVFLIILRIQKMIFKI